MKKDLKYKLFISIVIIFFSAAFLEVASFTIIKVYQNFIKDSSGKRAAQTSNKVDTQKSIIFVEAQEHDPSKEAKKFLDLAEQSSPYTYHAFIGWKHQDVSNSIINIHDGIRTSSENEHWNGINNIWFFGGSTIWGSHVSDSGTVPSMTTKITNHFRPVNLGEQSYNSRQELNLLINYLDKIKPGDQVVFYDGVNDYFTNCDARNGIKGHSRVGLIRELLRNKDNLLYSVARFINHSMVYIKTIIRNTYSQELATAISLRLFGPQKVYDELSEHYICNDDKKAYELAEFTINSWRAAETLVRERGAEMLCILQPNPYTYKGDSKVIPRLPWKLATEAVYPKTRELGKQLNCFRDMSDVFEHDYYLDDCCHVSRYGNYEIAKKIIMFVNEEKNK